MRWSIFVTLFDKSADFERRILQFANVKNALLNVLFRMKQKIVFYPHKKNTLPNAILHQVLNCAYQ